MMTESPIKFTAEPGFRAPFAQKLAHKRPSFGMFWQSYESFSEIVT